MTTISNMEARRQRGLDEARQFEEVRKQRPLHDYEERSLRKCMDLVHDMEERLQAARAREDRARRGSRLGDIILGH